MRNVMVKVDDMSRRNVLHSRVIPKTPKPQNPIII